MRIYLTSHVVKDVFPKRLPCKPEKMVTVAAKAWKSTEEILPGELDNQQHNLEAKTDGTVQIHYRKLMGFIFVFSEKVNGRIVLVTFYPPSTKLARMNAQEQKEKRKYFKDIEKKARLIKP